MGLLEMTDSQIRDLAAPILRDTIIGANNKDWIQFSKNMPEEDSSNSEIKKDVERQWEEDQYLTTFLDQAEFLAVIRKSDVVVVLWKLTSTATDDEYLERLYREYLRTRASRNFTLTSVFGFGFEDLAIAKNFESLQNERSNTGHSVAPFCLYYRELRSN